MRRDLPLQVYQTLAEPLRKSKKDKELWDEREAEKDFTRFFFGF